MPEMTPEQLPYSALCALSKAELEKQPCTCVSCSACGGFGNIWLDWKGRWLGNHRSDDLDEMESCEQCRGRGISETCDRCGLMDQDEEDARCL